MPQLFFSPVTPRAHRPTSHIIIKKGSVSLQRDADHGTQAQRARGVGDGVGFDGDPRGHGGGVLVPGEFTIHLLAMTSTLT